MELLVTDTLTIGVAGRSLIADLSWRIEGGQWWAILGPNGVGKSLLLATLAGLRPPQRGAIYLAGRPLTAWSRRERARWVGWLGQENAVPPATSVLTAVLAGLHPHLHRWRWEGDIELEQAHAALAALNLAHLAHRDTATLSGGERQRVALARLLLQNPSLYLLDEPLTHLDLRHQHLTLQLLQRRQAEGAAILTILHDPHWALRFATHLLLIGPNRPPQFLPIARLTATHLSELYGVILHPIGDRENPLFVPL
ncbi:MAG: ABC transporter ATP-binding protein [Hydrogenophilus sp.]|nr:ABC transporter ATP-binding protein [Hydrogenophilus sp.]